MTWAVEASLDSMNAQPIRSSLAAPIPRCTFSHRPTKALPEGTFGKSYSQFMEGHNFSPDSRSPVHFVDDPDLAYVMRRWAGLEALLES